MHMLYSFIKMLKEELAIIDVFCGYKESLIINPN